MAQDANGNILPTILKRKIVFIKQRVAGNRSKWCRAPWDLIQMTGADGLVKTYYQLRYTRVPKHSDDIVDAYDEIVLHDTGAFPTDPSGIAY